jgi:hypothetical protein
MRLLRSQIAQLALANYESFNFLDHFPSFYKIDQDCSSLSQRFSPKSVVNLKNKHNHNVSESMMRKDSSGGG